MEDQTGILPIIQLHPRTNYEGVSKHIIARDCVLEVCGAIVEGDNNIVIGSGNRVKGNKCMVQGTGNEVIGEDNQVRGRGNTRHIPLKNGRGYLTIEDYDPQPDFIDRHPFLAFLVVLGIVGFIVMKILSST